MFAKCILPAVKSRPDITQARAVRDRLASWRAGEYAALWREAVDVTRKRGKQTKKNQQQVQGGIIYFISWDPDIQDNYFA